jgi:hypothetical protein
LPTEVYEVRVTKIGAREDWTYGARIVAAEHPDQDFAWLRSAGAVVLLDAYTAHQPPQTAPPEDTAAQSSRSYTDGAPSEGAPHAEVATTR